MQEELDIIGEWCISNWILSKRNLQIKLGQACEL